MDVGMIDSLPIWSIYLGLTLCILLSFEVGYQISKLKHISSDTDDSSATNPMVGALLTMLAFVLAFTFAMASSQHNARKQNVLDESNAISTAFHRADLVDEPHKNSIKKLLQEYVDTRLQAVSSFQTGAFKAAINRSVEIQELLWNEVALIAAQEPNANTGLLVRSINDIIVIHHKRLNAALQNRIPSSIWLTLLAISALAMITMGNQTGLTKSRRLIAVIPLIMAFSALTTVIVDLDRPQKGMIKVSQQTMLDLKNSMVKKTQ